MGVHIPVMCRFMSVTLRQVLDLDVLRKAGARVVAGADGLDRPVRWVHIAEIPDIAELIKGGELLLTTGIGISPTAAAQRRYMTEIADAGAVGLVVELGRMFTSIPPGMVQVAQQRGFPLIALERETRYIEVTEAVHRAIVSDQYTVLHQAEEISRDFTDLILGGAGIREIIAMLAGILGNPVVLEDATGNMIEQAGRATAWEEHVLVAHDEAARGRVQRGPACLWVGIWLRHEEWGRVHVLETDRTLDEITGLVLDRAGTALGLVLLSQKLFLLDGAHLAGRARSALLADVLAGRHGTITEFLRRARSLGVDLSHGRLATLVLEPTALAEQARRNALGEAERQRIRLMMAEETGRAARELGFAALIGLDGDRVLAVAAVPAGGPVPRALDALAVAARRRIRAVDPSLAVVAGAGREVAVSSLQRSLEEATEAVDFARTASASPASSASPAASSAVHHFANLGIYQLLVRLAQDPELSRFVNSELSPVLEHDARSRAKLLPTLRSYLNNAGRKAETASSLRVQRRTLYARIGRIESVLGRSLDEADTRTRLTLALQGLDLLRDRDPGRPRRLA
jgi:purine catabolism regulator